MFIALAKIMPAMGTTRLGSNQRSTSSTSCVTNQKTANPVEPSAARKTA